ncbi:MAG: flagellar hook-associated protein FlgK [Clostridiales Family XIII bacterium]|jgi:flagellar hook-associated protein 1 FlgK|nr:flagellar hook-associated protein FlgK [Clostridiales Family XIII bacterium]
MRPTFLAFQTAHRAIATSQILLDTTGNNIANVNTDGYTRQRVDIAAMSNGGYIQRYKPQDVTAGGGVEAKRVSQIRDQFLDARYRLQNQADAKYQAVLSGFKDLENVLDETMYEGIMNEVATFKNALGPMLENPFSSDMAMVVRNSAQKITSILNTYSTHIDNVRNQQIFDVQSVYVDTQFNSVVKNIAALNKQINEEAAHGNTPNELYDERNLLFDQLSSLVNTKITITPKRLSSTLSVEHVQIQMVDDKTGKTIDLVDDETFNTLSAITNADGTLRLEVNSAFGNVGLKDITAYVTGGTLGGSLDVINGKGAEFGSYMSGDNLFRGTLYYQGMLDTFAANFARVMNDINRYNPNGVQPSDPTAPQLPVNQPRDLFTTIDASAVITARNIKVSVEWMDDPLYLTVTQPGDKSEGENIGRMMVAITNPQTGFYKQGNTAQVSVFNNGTFEEFLTGMSATLGLDVSLYTNYSKTSTYVMGTLFEARESVSGVSLEEEGTYLMAYQKSYNAAVRYFTVLDEAVDTIINKMGLVGR